MKKRKMITKEQNYIKSNYGYELDSVCDRIRLKCGRNFVTGRFVSFEVIIILGKQLSSGESFAVFSPYGFSLPQTRWPSFEGFTSVSVKGHAKVNVGPWHRGKQEWKRAVLVTVEEGELKKNDIIKIRFGDQSQGSPGMRVTYQASKGLLVACHRIKDKEEIYVPIQAASPMIQVVSSECKLVRGFATPVLARGEKGHFVLVAEDAYGNRADKFKGSVIINGAAGLGNLPRKVIFTQRDRGRKEFSFKANHSGIFFPVIEALGVNNAVGPIKVSSDKPKFRLYFGEIHAHTELSCDAAGSIDECYELAQKTACLDFAAAADHWAGISGRTGVLGHENGFPCELWENMPERWKATCDAARHYHKPHKFVTIVGYETNDKIDLSGHRNIYFLEDYPPSMEMPDSPPKGSFAQWLSKMPFRVKGRKVLVIPHHTGNAFRVGTFENKKGMCYSDLPDKIQPVIEIYSRHGTSEFLDNPRPCRGQLKGHFARDILAQGHKFGFIGGSDTHQANLGSSMEQAGPSRTQQYRGGLVAVWARELTRESIWEAIFARRVYATTYPRIIIQFRIGDVPMGGVGEVPYPRYIKAEIASPLRINRVELIKNGEFLKAIPSGDDLRIPYIQGEAIFEDTEPSGRKEDYYYLRIVMDGGEMAWSSPIWVRS